MNLVEFLAVDSIRLTLGALESPLYWYGRFFFYRGFFLTYFLAFLVATRQFIPLTGEDGIIPFTRRLTRTSPWSHPSLLRLFPSDASVLFLSVLGLVLSAVGLCGGEWLGFWPISILCLVLWASYLSLMNAGGLFYGFGWESFLVETGFLSVFMGSAYQQVSLVGLVLVGWLLFRVMFGAGLIKLRGDECWRDLTCMDYHYETQPMPNPLSWFAHHLPRWWHKLEVLGNHLVELVVPFFYLAPQPWSGLGGVLTVLFQGWLMLTGNFSWLNFLTIVVALPLVPDWMYGELGARFAPGELASLPVYQHVMVGVYGLAVLVLSYWPIKNFFSSRQLMNASFDPFNFVNTYGAFGSITKKRYELVVEGRRDGKEWKTYEFKGKPTDVNRRPPQWAPYHLRLDWQMWFAGMRRRPRYWILGLIRKLFEENEFHRMIRTDPFRDQDGPDEIRVSRYRYSFTGVREGYESGRWWSREFVEPVFPPMDYQSVMNRLG